MKNQLFLSLIGVLLGGCVLDTVIVPQITVIPDTENEPVVTREDDLLYERVSEFSLLLSKRPTSDVIIRVSADVSGEVVIQNDEIVFTPEDYDKPQMVKISGIMDSIEDGDQKVNLLFTASSEDIAFNNKTVVRNLLNKNVDKPEILLSYNSRLETSEGGKMVEISGELSSKPLAPVIVSVKVSDPLEAVVDPKSFKFDPNNWDEAQIITVTGLPDNQMDGDKKYYLEFDKSESDDEKYNGIQLENLELVNRDIDHADFMVRYEGSLVTRENGSDRLKVYAKLTSMPKQGVSVELNVNDETEAEVSPAQLVFTSENWNVEQVVTVWGRDDDEFDGDQEYALVFSPSVSGDLNYNGKVIDPIPMKNVDDDTLSVDVVKVHESEISCDGSTQEGIVDIKLSMKPITDISVELSLFDKNGQPIAGLRSEPSLLHFSPDNWDKPQSVTIRAPGKEDIPSKAYYKYVYLNSKILSKDEAQYPEQTPTLLFSLKAVCDPGDFNYTGEVQKVRLSPGHYLMTVVGAGGGSSHGKSNGGIGGKASAEFKLKKPTDVFVYVGGAGHECADPGVCAGYNGGSVGCIGRNSGGGGGASDIRAVKDSYENRVIVAGGGGGGAYILLGKTSIGGSGGWEKGESGKTGTSEHKETPGGGLNGCSDGSNKCKFGEVYGTPSINYCGGGGGGWYSGLSGQQLNVSGAGGSGFIYGYQQSDKTALDDDVIEFVSGTANWSTGADRDTNGSASIRVVAKEIE